MSLKMAYSHAVDCWAVGIVLYVLLCGWARLLRLRQAVARSARWHSQRCPNALLRVPQKIVKPLAGWRARKAVLRTFRAADDCTGIRRSTTRSKRTSCA